MAERVFARKMQKVGFDDVQVVDRVPFGIDRVSAYPLFTSDVLGLMRDLMPADRLEGVAVSVIVKANKRT